MKLLRTPAKKPVSRNKDIMAGAYVISGTRIMVGSIKRFYDAGYDIEGIKESYPHLTTQQIIDAINFRRKEKI